jgi:hypothetical protein
LSETAASSTPIAGPVPDGMPDPNLVPPQIARSGDPFALLRIVHFLSRVRRNQTHQLRDVVVALNAAFLDWSFSEKLVLAEVVQLQANWSISFHGDDRIVLDRNERGHTLLIIDSTKMTAFFVAERVHTGRRRFARQLTSPGSPLSALEARGGEGAPRGHGRLALGRCLASARPGVGPAVGGGPGVCQVVIR